MCSTCKEKYLGITYLDNAFSLPHRALSCADCPDIALGHYGLETQVDSNWEYYGLLEDGAAECPTVESSVQSEHECLVAGTAVGGTTLTTSPSDPTSTPCGCFMDGASIYWDSTANCVGYDSDTNEYPVVCRKYDFEELYVAVPAFMHADCTSAGYYDAGTECDVAAAFFGSITYKLSVSDDKLPCGCMMYNRDGYRTLHNTASNCTVADGYRLVCKKNENSEENSEENTEEEPTFIEGTPSHVIAWCRGDETGPFCCNGIGACDGWNLTIEDTTAMTMYKGSCIGDGACSGVYSTATFGRNACVGDYACDRTTSSYLSIYSFIAEDNSCVGSYACYLSDGSSIPSLSALSMTVGAGSCSGGTFTCAELQSPEIVIGAASCIANTDSAFSMCWNLVHDTKIEIGTHACNGTELSEDVCSNCQTMRSPFRIEH